MNGDGRLWVGGREPEQIFLGTRAVNTVFLGDHQIWPPIGRVEIHQFTDPNGPGPLGAWRLPVPWWAAFAVPALWGGGGGGAGGDGAFRRDGTGGQAPENGGAQLSLLDVSRARGAELSITVGRGGAGGAAERSGNPGGDSRVIYGAFSATNKGGAGGSGYGNANGAAARNLDVTDKAPEFPKVTGGYGGSRDRIGGAPGGGGGGGSGGTFGGGNPGQPGGNGRVIVAFYSSVQPWM